MTGDLIYDSIATYNAYIIKLYAAGFQPISDKISKKKNLDLLKQQPRELENKASESFWVISTRSLTPGAIPLEFE